MITLIVAILILCSYVLCKYEYFTSCTVQILIFYKFCPIILMCVFHVAISLAFLSCTLYTIYSGLILRGKFSRFLRILLYPQNLNHKNYNLLQIKFTYLAIR